LHFPYLFDLFFTAVAFTTKFPGEFKGENQNSNLEIYAALMKRADYTNELQVMAR